ncbi:MAG: hypothetical protein K6A45_01575 [Lachnospiraceae bacterium]|nr:hypothetical protein [Lachnospiraceae bacterium]
MDFERYIPELYEGCGVSSFIFHKGVSLMRDSATSDKKARFAYVRDSIADGSLDDFKMDILTCVYRFSFMNTFLIEKALGSRTEGRNLSNAISYLVDHGFLKKLYGNYGSSATKYFYSVDKGVAEYLRIRGGIESSIYRERIDIAYNYLSRNQFALAAESSLLFIESTLHTKLMLKKQGKELDLGYSAVMKGRRLKIRLVAIPVRRFPFWWEESVQRVRLALCLATRKKTVSIPVCICEDYEHMQDMASLLEGNEKTAGREVLYCMDAGTVSWDIGDNLFETKSVIRLKGPDGRERLAAKLEKVRLN